MLFEPTFGVAARARAALEADLTPARTSELAGALHAKLLPLIGPGVASSLIPLRPLFVSRGTSARVSQSVWRTILRIRRALGRRGFTPGDLDVVRPDGALSGDAFSLFELNVGSCVGGLAEVEHMSDVMAPWADEVLRRARIQVTWPRPLHALARALELRYGMSSRYVWTVLPGALASEWGAPLAEQVLRVLRDHGLDVEAAESDALVFDGESVRLGSTRVDVLIRVVDAAAWITDDSVAHLREAAMAGRVKVFSSTYEIELASKQALVQLSRDGDPIVPWTRRALPAMEDGVDLLPYVRAHAEDYVLKPSWGRQGERVAIGREDPALFGQLLVASVLAKDCVLQRYVSTPTALVPYAGPHGVVMREAHVVTSPVLISGAPPALCARVSVPGGTLVLTHPALGTTGIVPVVEALGDAT